MGLIIDTTVFILAERRGEAVEDLLRRRGLAAEPAGLAAITASELLVGIHRAREDRRARREVFVEAVLDRFAVLPFDLVVARIHARLSAQLEAAGSRMGAHDLEIAATAIAHRYGVLTGDPRGFDRVPGLTVERLQ